MAMNITYTEFKVAVLLPDGTEYIKDYISAVPYPTIGEKKRVIMSFTTDYNMANVNLWMKFALFNQGIISVAPSIAKTPLDYAITFPSTLTAGKYPIAFVCPTGLNSNLQQNAEANLVIVDSTHFNIEFDFFQVYDELSYQNTTIQDNHSKLLKDYNLSPSELTLTSTKTCYNTNLSKLCTTFRFEKGTDYSDIAMGSNWMASFYNRNPLNNTPYFHNPVWTLERTTTVTNLSSIANTNVKFNINSDTTITKILGWIIRTDKFDNSVSMQDNYESDFKDLISTNPDLNDKIIAPIVDISLISGTTYEVQYTIDCTKLVDGAKYRLIAIVYDDVTLKSNSFISPEYTVDALPCYKGNGFDAIGALDDYNRQYEGNDLECVIEERMRSKIFLSFPFDKWKNDLLNRLGLYGSNDIRRYLTKVKIDFYDENYVLGLGVVRNLYDTKTVIKTGINTYTTQPGMTLNFGSTWAEFIYEWRNRFENNIDCLETSVDNSYTVTPVQAKQYWGGKTIKIRWTLSFFYDDYKAPFTDDVEFFQQIRVEDYGDLSVRHWDNSRGSKFDEITNFCQGEIPCFGSIIDGSFNNRKLITNIVPLGAGINAISEAEAWVGNQLGQLTTDKITDQDEDFATSGGSKIANFCIDTSKLLISSYQISAISKKEVDTGLRITEKGDPSVFEQRITEENNNRRIIDNL